MNLAEYRPGDAAIPPPEVTIITTVLNGESYLAEAIESVLAQQAAPSWELLLVDDGSRDRSLPIALDYAARFPERIFVLQHRRGCNRGISASRNLGLRHARGQVLAFLDADDVWLPHKLASQISVLRQHPGITMTYAAAERWLDFDLPYDSARGSLGRNFLPPLIPDGQHAGLLAAGKLLDWFRADESMTPCTCTVLVRTAEARRLGGFVNSFRGLYDDQAFYAKLALQQQVHVSLHCVARYRQHATSCCARARANDALQQRERSSFDRWLQTYQSARSFGQPVLTGIRQ